jgi:hypothetical protein
VSLPLGDAGALAGLLCALTDEILYAPRAARLAREAPWHRYRSRVGSGRQTCLRHYPDGRLEITYGRRMVQDKYDREHSRVWATSRELERFGWFGGRASPAHTLAHTALHEFAHLLQAVRGQRRAGSVHNTAFYRTLGELHEEGDGERLYQQLVGRAGAAGLPLVFREPGDEEQARRSARQQAYAALAVGDRVRLRGRGRDYLGTVRRINRRTVSCDLDDGGRLRFSEHADFERL